MSAGKIGAVLERQYVTKSTETTKTVFHSNVEGEFIYTLKADLSDYSTTEKKIFMYSFFRFLQVLLWSHWILENVFHYVLLFLLDWIVCNIWLMIHGICSMWQTFRDHPYQCLHYNHCFLRLFMFFLKSWSSSHKLFHHVANVISLL